ncbi:MAG: PHP domain-containing protein [Pseudomonadota bacterium]
MPVIDLHSHSQCSDGSLSPADLVALAVRAGVKALALTDHDSVDGISEARAAAQGTGLTLIAGVELSAVWGVHNIHVVGLQVDIQNPILKAGLAQQAGARAERGRQMGAKLEALGLKGAYEGALALASSPDGLSRTHMAQWLFDAGHVSTIQQAFDKYLGPRKPAAVPMPWASLADVVAWIKAAGGVAVVAHPGRYDMSRTKMRQLLADFKALGGDGMEVATATEKPDMVAYLGRLSQQLELLASQGSDYHGKPAPWIALGRFPSLPAGCVPIWTAWGWPATDTESVFDVELSA